MTSIKFPLLTKDYLTRRYVDELARVEEIAAEVGCSVANIKKRIKDWRVLRGKVLQATGLVRSWNEGLTKDTDPRLASVSRKNSGVGNGMAGAAVWNKGLTAADDERLAALSQRMSGRTVTDETRAKQRAAKVGRYGPASNRWKGGKTYLNGYGAHRMSTGGVRKYAHRMVAEEALGRPLTRHEHVHHIDRNKSHNERPNLLVLSHMDHNRLHRAIDAGAVSREAQIAWLIENGIKFEELV
jgi:HNH endonuclease